MSERQVFSEELKAEAIRMVFRDGLSQREVDRRLGISNTTIGSWVTNYKGDGVEGLSGTPSVAELVKEVGRLRKELAQARMESEILKKATAYFAKESLRGHESVTTPISD
jgi:transposase